ncbi:MAG TPA: hypothetical protein VH438_09880 [Gemmatimonadales bacterium]
MNNLGQIVGSSDVTGGGRHVFRWVAGTMQDLGFLATGNVGAPDPSIGMV